MNFELSFFLGFLCTAGLFLFCLITVAFINTVKRAVLMFLTKKAPVETPAPVQTKQPKKPPARVKCIQIDPALVDKIYVKKSS